MYCIKCGVQMTDGQKKCPLCGTAVYHPDFVSEGDSLFPKSDAPVQEYNKSGILFVITVLYVLALSIIFVCDAAVFGALTWSVYAAPALLLTYVIIILPMWFKHPNPVIFVPCDFAAALGLLLIICIRTGGDWFLTFAMPAVLGIGLITSAVITLRRYVKRGFLYVLGGSFITFGFFTVVLEYLIRNAFFDSIRFIWSYYPALVFFILGMMLIVVAICKPLRRSLEKVFFIGYKQN